MPYGTEAFGTEPFGGGVNLWPIIFPTFRVEIEFETDVWTDITGWVETVSVKAGRERELERYATGTSVVVADTAGGRFDPVDPGSPYDGFLLPGKHIRCVLEWNGVEYPLFHHLTEDFQVDYDGSPTVRIPASDWFGQLAGTDLPDTPYALLVRAAGPKAWWRLGDSENQSSTTTAADSSVDGAHAGVYHGTPGFGAEVAPWGDARGVSFDGGEWVDVPASAAVTDEFTIEGTLVTDVTDFDALGPDVDAMHLFSQGPNRIWNSAGYYDSTRGIQIRMLRDGDGSIEAVCGGASVESAGGYNDGEPHLVRITWDGTTFALLIDGSEVDSTTTIPNPSPRPAAPVRLGRQGAADASGYDWKGGLQDWQMYDEVLTEADFADRYEAWKHGWADDTSGERIARILDLAGVPTAYRDLDAGNSTLIGAEFGSNALEELHLVNDTEDGVLFVDVDGTVTFRERHARYFAPYTESQATFYDDDPANPVDSIMYETVTPANPVDGVRNHVEIEPLGGDKQVGEDAASIAKYNGVKPYSKRTLHDSANAAKDAVNWILLRYADPGARFRTITLTPYGQEDLMWPQILGRRIGDRVTVVRRLLSGDELEQECHIEGYEHSFDGYGRWVTTWMLSPADPNTFWIVEDPVYGQVDVTARVGA